MFQTELLIWIQSGVTDAWTAFFSFWSLYTSWVIPLVLIIFFGIHARAGFVLIQALVWDMTASLNLKELVMLPRPCSVDSRVALPGEGGPNLTPFHARGARGFWGELPKDAVESFRAAPFDTWGFPSGHTSSATTFGGLAFLVFRRPWFRFLLGALMICVPLSRLYLGRHFLADVLGGYALGAFFVLAFTFGMYRRASFQEFFSSPWSRTPWSAPTAVWLLLLILMPPLFLLLPGTPWEGAGALLGFNLGFFWIKFRGMPPDTGTPAQRIGRVLTAGVLFAALEGTGRYLGFLVCPGDPPALRFFRTVIVLALLVRGTIWICARWGLYSLPDMGRAPHP
jgi:membrane-associated phospholipid phosphatase